MIAVALAWFSTVGVPDSPKWFYMAHAGWIAILTWYGWLSHGGMFVVHEVVGAGIDLRRGWLLQQSSKVVWFLLLIALFNGVPLWLHQTGRLRRGVSGEGSTGSLVTFLRIASVVCILL